MDNIAIVAEQVGVLFALMSVGAGCRLTKLLDDGAVKGIVNILMLVVTPCLVVDCFNRPFNPERLKSLGAAFILAFAVHVCLLLFPKRSVSPFPIPCSSFPVPQLFVVAPLGARITRMCAKQKSPPMVSFNTPRNECFISHAFYNNFYQALER